MTLTTQVTDRYDTATLTQLSNAGSPGTKTVTTANITTAADDIESTYFPMYVGKAYDETNFAAGIPIAVEGVIALLRYRFKPNNAAAKAAWDAWVEMAQRFAQSKGGRRRVTPVTTSQTTHSTYSGSQPLRPPFDSEAFEDHKPNQPRGPRTDVGDDR